MSIQSAANREFNKHISSALNQMCKVELEFEHRYYIGRLVGVDMATLSLCLESVKDEKNNKIDKIFIRGNSWTTLQTIGEPFPMEKLLERLKKILPGEEITLNDDNTIHLLGGKLKISEKGVDGRGPTAERVQKVFESFVQEISQKHTN